MSPSTTLNEILSKTLIGPKLIRQIVNLYYIQPESPFTPILLLGLHDSLNNTLMAPLTAVSVMDSNNAIHR